MKVTIEYQKSIGSALRGLELYDQHDNRFTTIFPGQSQDLETPAELSSIYGKMDWGKTEVLKLSDATEPLRIRIENRFTVNPLRMLGLMRLPISLEQVKE